MSVHVGLPRDIKVNMYVCISKISQFSGLFSKVKISLKRCWIEITECLLFWSNIEKKFFFIYLQFIYKFTFENILYAYYQ